MKTNQLYRRFYTIEDLEPHSTYDNCWVVIHSRVLDISQLLIDFKGDPLGRPLINNAGTDISRWFDKTTGNPKQYVDTELGMRTFYLPEGRFLHVPPTLPGPSEAPISVPWWKDVKYEVGRLTAKNRGVRVINTLSHHEEVLHVPAEETINEIQTRYLDINKHSESYTWKDYTGRLLDMNKTLAENGIMDQDPEYDYLDIPEEDRLLPSLMIYFNDDLTLA